MSENRGGICAGLTYLGDGQISEVERHGFDLNQDIVIAKLGERNVLLQNKAIEAVFFYPGDRPCSSSSWESHCDKSVKGIMSLRVNLRW